MKLKRYKTSHRGSYPYIFCQQKICSRNLMIYAEKERERVIKCFCHKSLQLCNDCVNDLLSSALSTKIFSPALPFRDHSLHCCFEPVSKWRKLKMSKHHGWWEKQRHWVCFVFPYYRVFPDISCWCTLLKHRMVSPNVSCSYYTSLRTFPVLYLERVNESILNMLIYLQAWLRCLQQYQRQCLQLNYHRDWVLPANH